jgi:hypothetical protein
MLIRLIVILKLQFQCQREYLAALVPVNYTISGIFEMNGEIHQLIRYF